MTTANHTTVLDLDTLLPEQKIVKLKDIEFDVTEMPLGLSMKMVAFQNELSDSEDTMVQLEAIADMILSVLRLSKPDLTLEWVKESISMQKMMQLIDFVVSDINDTVSSEEVTTGESEGSPSPEAAS